MRWAEPQQRREANKTKKGRRAQQGAHARARGAANNGAQCRGGARCARPPFFAAAAPSRWSRAKLVVAFNQRGGAAAKSKGGDRVCARRRRQWQRRPRQRARGQKPSLSRPPVVLADLRQPERQPKVGAAEVVVAPPAPGFVVGECVCFGGGARLCDRRRRHLPRARV